MVQYHLLTVESKYLHTSTLWVLDIITHCGVTLTFLFPRGDNLFFEQSFQVRQVSQLIDEYIDYRKKLFLLHYISELALSFTELITTCTLYRSGFDPRSNFSETLRFTMKCSKQMRCSSSSASKRLIVLAVVPQRSLHPVWNRHEIRTSSCRPSKAISGMAEEA